MPKLVRFKKKLLTIQRKESQATTDIVVLVYSSLGWFRSIFAPVSAMCLSALSDCLVWVFRDGLLSGFQVSGWAEEIDELRKRGRPTIQWIHHKWHDSKPGLTTASMRAPTAPASGSAWRPRRPVSRFRRVFRICGKTTIASRCDQSLSHKSVGLLPPSTE